MTQQQTQPKFSPDYKVTLFALILRCVEKQTKGKQDQRTRDMKYLAHQQLRAASDEAEVSPP